MNKENLQPVLDSGMCVACGACIAADFDVTLEFDQQRMMYQPSGPGSSDAARVCPAMQVDFSGLHDHIFPGATVTEHGVISSVHLAQSTNRERNVNSSSGGMIKELLHAYLADETVDGVIALAKDRGLQYKPVLITDPAKIDQLPGSIYHNLPLDGTLALLRENQGRYILVTLPCQLEGIYTYIHTCEPSLADRIHTVIGLSCGWNYSHHALKAICSFKGIDYETISDISYRGGGPVGKLVITTPGKTRRINRRVDFSYQVAFDRSFNIPRCHVCVDHVNYLADIVVADAWLPSTVMTKTGISMLICRTAETTAMVRKLEKEGKIRCVDADVDDIVESQKRAHAFGDFAYGYAAYLKSIGEHCPEMEAPNYTAARPVSERKAAAFYRDVCRKRKWQYAGKYRYLLLRKGTVELPRFSWKYLRWFLVRVLKVKSLFGVRKEISHEELKEFS
jgi:coenzyme F420 hydrogenase subunit beta